jgi:aryl-alcohol dehydrogenase-like predicted oxidoreductase
MEEIVRAMHDIIAQGKALYWGTSEWNSQQITEAWRIAEHHHLHKPQMEQPQYNLLVRDKVENDFASLYADLGLGLTTWSPLCSGLLSGKYTREIPQESRAALPGYQWLQERWSPREREQIVPQLVSLAHDLGCTPSQLAIAWCLKNPHVSTVILGASKREQLKENLASVDIVKKLTREVLKAIDAAISIS